LFDAAGGRSLEDLRSIDRVDDVADGAALRDAGRSRDDDLVELCGAFGEQKIGGVGVAGPERQSPSGLRVANEAHAHDHRAHGGRDDAVAAVLADAGAAAQGAGVAHHGHLGADERSLGQRVGHQSADGGLPLCAERGGATKHEQGQ